jgi:voltage-gated potassium channel
MRLIKEAQLIIIITIAFGFLYSRMDPEEFGFKTTLDPYYFSFTTSSSVGYGDLSPKTDRAKMLVMIQQAFMLGELTKILYLYRKK